jgi:4-hydroxy-tetrahydrodipicolinate reductase
VLNVAVLGITGRMGREVALALETSGPVRLSGALCSPASRSAGSLVADVVAGSSSTTAISASLEDALRGADVAIDFTLPEATTRIVAACAADSVPLVVCTTGLGDEQRAAIDEAAARIPVLIAANTSVGIALLTRLAGLAAEVLGDAFDVEIIEAHHAHKRDIPSGTALQLGAAVAAARGDEPLSKPRVRPAGTGELRERGEIGFASIRAGEIAGEHTLLFAGGGERVELVHRVSDRSTFAAGAIRAARWLASQPAGRYAMADALGL